MSESSIKIVFPTAADRERAEALRAKASALQGGNLTWTEFFWLAVNREWST